MQRFDSALSLDPHLHALVLDGVYTGFGRDESLAFRQSAPLRDEEVETLVGHLRLLIESISVTKLKDELKLKLKGEVHWTGGQTTDLELAWHRYNQHAADTDLLELIRALAREFIARPSRNQPTNKQGRPARGPRRRTWATARPQS